MTTEEFKHHILPLKNKLFRFALSYLASQADARDVVQEVMLNAWTHIKDLNAIGNPEAWCMTAARNKALNMLKKKGRNHLPVEDQYDLPSESASPLKLTEAKEVIDKIRGIIASLPEKQREVIRLRDVEEYSYKEIAEILQLELNHVKILLFRARKQGENNINAVTELWNLTSSINWPKNSGREHALWRKNNG